MGPATAGRAKILPAARIGDEIRAYRDTERRPRLPDRMESVRPHPTAPISERMIPRRPVRTKVSRELLETASDFRLEGVRRYSALERVSWRSRGSGWRASGDRHEDIADA